MPREVNAVGTEPADSRNHNLDEQQRHWQDSFVRGPEMFGAEPSEPARKTVELFWQEEVRTLLELGGGEGRDTIFFAKRSLQVAVID